MKLLQRFGYRKDLPIVDTRLAVDQMLLTYIEQLARLRPDSAQILLQRFKDRTEIKRIAFNLHLSEEQVNRRQQQAINFLAGLLYDEEVLVGKFSTQA